MAFRRIKIWTIAFVGITLIIGVWMAYRSFAKQRELTDNKTLITKPKAETELKISHLSSDIKAGISYETKLSFPADKKIDFSEQYADLKGILTFRGGPYRDRASVGVLTHQPDSFRVLWNFYTDIRRDSLIGGQTNWYGGNGWTGQPCLVEWTKSYLTSFDSLYPAFRSRETLREVIVGSLNGKIYFIDLNTGKATRPYFDTKNPIKGTISVIPASRPYLFAGQGIPYTEEFGFRIFDLSSHKKVLFQNGRDAFAYRGWGAFDGSPLMDFKNGRLWCSGENGIIYQLNLLAGKNTFQANKFRYKVKNCTRGGIESSFAAYKNLAYFTDNAGNIICLDLQAFQPVWISKNGDDTDASPVIEIKEGLPYLYTGCEVDLQGDNGTAWVRKLDGLLGKVIWEIPFDCYSVRGAKPVNGGMVATPLLGKNKASKLIVVSLSRYKSMYGGCLVALDKETGKEIYQIDLESFAWSSPLDLYDQEGNMYIFTADSGGRVYLIDGMKGKVIYSKNLGCTFEASPVAFDNKVVLGARGTNIFCFSVE